MLVRATKRGYYGVVLREPGQVFKLKPYTVTEQVSEQDKNGKITGTKSVKRFISEEDQFADHEADHGLGWMERVDQKSAKPSKGGAKAAVVGNRPIPEDASELNDRIAAADRMAEEAAAEDNEVI